MEQLVVDQVRLQRDLKVHGTDTQLELYALGRLPDPDLATLEEHLLVCASCREKLDGFRDFVLGMRDAGVQSLASPEGPGRITWVGFRMNPRLASFLRRPAVSMGLAFVILMLVIAIFSTRNRQIAPSASLRLMATRGAMPATGPANSLDLKLIDAPREGGPFRIEVLSTAGASVLASLAESTPSGVQININRPLPPGDYFVRLYSASGVMLREYGFRIQ